MHDAQWRTFRNRGYTIYNGCAQDPLPLLKIATWLSVCVLLISLVFVLPSIVILLRFTKLRRLQRVRLHINLLFALFLRTTARFVWQTSIILPKFDQVDNYEARHLIRCKVTKAVNLYLETCCYICFLCEGCYLYRLISNAFRRPRRLIYMYLLSWVFPVFPIGLYFLLSSLLHPETLKECWPTVAATNYLYIIPNLAAVTLNFFILLYILRVLISRFANNSVEVAIIRRTLKAVSVLVPIFGIQVCFTMFRTPEESFLATFVMNVCTSLTEDLQGVWASLVLCFFNREVRLLFMGSVASAKRRSYARSFNAGVRNSCASQRSRSLVLTTFQASRRRSRIRRSSRGAPKIREFSLV